MNIDGFKTTTNRILKMLMVTSPIHGDILTAGIKNKTFQISGSNSEEIFYQGSKTKVGYILGSQTYFSLLSIILM